MSNHRTPVTEIERAGMEAHGLARYIGKPNQLCDVFRQGVVWGLANAPQQWVPIAEADLRAGEVVDIRNRRGTRFVNCTYRPDMEAFVNDVTAPSIVMAEFITHILRITPPTSAGGG